MNSLTQSLLDNGWKEFPDQFHPKFRAFAKSFAGHAECAGNTGKNKQVEIYYSPREVISGHIFNESLTVQLHGELPNGEWLRINIESITTTPLALAMAEVALKAWDAAVKSTPPSTP